MLPNTRNLDGGLSVAAFPLANIALPNHQRVSVKSWYLPKSQNNPLNQFPFGFELARQSTYPKMLNHNSNDQNPPVGISPSWKASGGA
jgi:hypothetical protein